MTAPPVPGTMRWMRGFYGDQCRRGAEVRVPAGKGRVLSARGGLLFVRVWSTGERVAVRPSEAVTL